VERKERSMTWGGEARKSVDRKEREKEEEKERMGREWK
jgi:hypothetical protein